MMHAPNCNREVMRQADDSAKYLSEPCTCADAERPAPWSFAVFERSERTMLCDANARPILSFDWRDGHRTIAARIVAAVNAHDELVAALQACILTHCPNDRLFCGTCTDARKLLARLEAERVK